MLRLFCLKHTRYAHKDVYAVNEFQIFCFFVFFSSGPQAQWQFLDMDGSWKDYSKVSHNFLFIHV